MLLYYHVMAKKFNRNHGNRSGARARERGKRASAHMAAMREGKLTGEREDVDFYEDERAFALHVDDRPLVAKPRDVVVGPVGGGRMARTNVDGTVTVAAGALRKQSSESWSAYKARVPSGLSQMPVMAKRLSAAEARDEYFDEVEDKLRSYHFKVMGRYTIGRSGQGQRARAVRRQMHLMRDEYSKGGQLCAQIVTDTDGGPTVVFPYRYQKLPATLADFSIGSYFHQEAQYVLSKVAGASTIPSDEVLLGSHQGIMPHDVMCRIPELASIVGSSVVEEATSFLQSNWRGFIAVSCELHAFSLVAPEQRLTYVVSRGISEAIRSDVNTDAVRAMLLRLLSSPHVVGFVGALGATFAKPSVFYGDGIPEGVFQGLADMFPAGVGAAMSPGTAAHGMVAVCGALYALVNYGGSSLTLGNCAGVLIHSMTRIPRVASVEDAVGVLLKHLPQVFQCISIAVSTGSLVPLFMGSETAYMRYVDVHAAYVLRKQGKYDETLFRNDGEFLVALAECVREMQVLVSRGDAQALRVWKDLVDMQAQVRADQGGKFRVQPYAFALVGESGIGKSDIMHKVVASLTSERYGRPTPTDKVYTRQMFDQYWSGYRQDMEVCIFDDVSNAKAAPGTSLPNQCHPLVQAINNVSLPLVMADLESKGNVTFTSEFVAVTSNLRDLRAPAYSNEPISVLRRFDVFIEPHVRAQYRVVGSAALDPSKVPDAALVPVPNLWSFHLWQPRKAPRALQGELQWVRLDFPEEGTILDLLDYLDARSKAHFVRQEALVASHATKDYMSYSRAELRHLMHVGEGVVAGPALAHADEVVVQSFGLSSLPMWLRPHHAFSGALPRMGVGAIDALRGVGSNVRGRINVAAFDAFGALCYSQLKPEVVSIVCCMALIVGSRLLWLLLAISVGVLSLAHDRHVHRQTLTARSLHPGAFAAAAALLTWVFLSRRPSNDAPPPQVVGQSAVDFAVPSRMGCDVPILSSDVPATVRTGTLAQLQGEVGSKSRFVVLSSLGGSSERYGIGVFFPVCQSLYATNRHIVAPFMNAGFTGIRLLMYWHGNSAPQQFDIGFSQIFCPEEDVDVVFVKLIGPTERDVRPNLIPDAWIRGMQSPTMLFPVVDALALMTRVPTSVLSAHSSTDPRGQLALQHIRLIGDPVVRQVKFAGSIYRAILMRPANGETKAGDCGSPVLMSARSGTSHLSVVAGIHSGVVVREGVSYAVVAPVTRGMLERAEAFFLAGVHQGAGGLFGQPPGLRLDVEASHPNLPQPDKYVTSLGVLVDARGANTSSKNTFSSELRRGLFYGPHAVDAILGPLGHTFPTNTRDIVHFQRPLESMARKKDDYDTYVLDAAKADYLESLRFWLEGNLPVRPASLFEACNKDALMPSLPLMTACGFGHPGKKEKYVVCCCERSCTDPHCGLTHPGVDDYVVPGRTNYYPCAEIFAEVVDLENKLAGGEHDLAVFKTTLKDEPVALGKDKIRAFYVGSMALNLLVRRYLMPFMCRLQQHRDYECEVGIDVQSSDWEELQYDLASFGNDMRIGGDYKGFDLSTHEALLRGFYDSLVTLARDAGWDDRSVRIVRGLGANLSRPVYLFLGQAFRVEGSNPSGVAITTHANSGVNSLIHRYAFYMRNRALVQAAKLLPGVGTLFTRDVCLRTYGDDVIGSVRDCESGLNNHDIRDAAACFGMVYGPIDKGSAELPLIITRTKWSF
jgi:ABC-type oligopeptide transport system ATPase subunit